MNSLLRLIKNSSTFRILQAHQASKQLTAQPQIRATHLSNGVAVCSATQWHSMRVLTSSADIKKNPSTQSPSSQVDTPPPRRSTMAQEIREHAKMMREGTTSHHDMSLIDASEARVFPRIKTTSLSTKRIVIHDEAAQTPITLVLVAFRSYADDQLKPWREAFDSNFGQHGRWFDVTVNESFAAKAFSGFVQRWQRGRTDPALHDFFVAFNNRAKEPLEVLMLNTNRLLGNILLLDRRARVRFRAIGSPSPHGVETFLACARQIIKEDGQTQDQ